MQIFPSSPTQVNHLTNVADSRRAAVAKQQEYGTLRRLYREKVMAEQEAARKEEEARLAAEAAAQQAEAANSKKAGKKKK